MKIAIICDVLGRANNGTTLAALNLIDYLKRQGHDVTVVSPDETTKGKDGYLVVPPVNLGKFLNGVLKKNGVSLAKADKTVLEKAIAGADVVHLLIPFPLSMAAIKIAKKHHVPITASFHCQAENFTEHVFLRNGRLANHLVYRFFYKKTYRHCDAVHFPTEFIRETFSRHYRGELCSYVISNGVNDAFFESRPTIPHDKFTICCTGRFSGEKAQWQLLKALKDSPVKSEVCVKFAGDGPKKNKLEKMAKRYGIDATFQFYSREELLNVLHSADLYVHTAEVEIEAISCTEAIAAGLVPIICDSKKSATKFFALCKESLFPYKDCKTLRKRIEYFYDNPDELSRVRELYKAEKVAFRGEECMKKMEEMLSTVAGEKKN